MPTIAVFSAHLIGGPAKPVICLDTCDILEVVQCLDWERPGVQRGVGCIQPVRQVLDALIVDPDRVQLVITDLVRHEWIQNIRGIRRKAKEYLSKIDDVVGTAYRAAAAVGTGMPVYTTIESTALVADVVGLSSRLLRQAARLDIENAIINRALNRVMAKRRPSHDGHIKDSINFEHYLELARQLRAGGFAESILFVSKNRKDYWHGDTGHIHPHLAPEIDNATVQIQFFGNLNAALGFLHI